MTTSEEQKKVQAVTLNNFQNQTKDKRMMKKTTYDLANKSDWRDVSGDQMKGPIDYVAKNKAQ